jgi:hypothetical protein
LLWFGGALTVLLFCVDAFHMSTGGSPAKAVGSAINAARRRPGRTSIMDRQRNLIRDTEDPPLRGRRTTTKRAGQPKQREKKPTMTPAERRAKGDAMRKK